jgi:hypothetical protein
MSWSIYKNKTIPDVFPFQCVNTIKTTCNDSTFQRCLYECQQSGRCNYGTFTPYPKSGGQTDELRGECKPLNTLNYQDINPYDFFVDAPGDNVVFVNNGVFSLQQSAANTVHFDDLVCLQNVETKLYLQYGTEDSYFSDFAPFKANLTIEKKTIDVPQSLLLYGNFITFGVPAKPLVLTGGFNRDCFGSFGNVTWNNITPFAMTKIALFQLEPISTGAEKEVEGVNFEDEFYIKILGSYLTVEEPANIGILKRENVDVLKATGANMKFRLLPAEPLKGYYCSKEAGSTTSKCEELPLWKSEVDKTDRRKREHQGAQVMRNETCYFQC